jgi:hypothetical protein
MAGALSGDRLCVNACISPSAEADRNYWSNAAVPPFDWVTLESFGLGANAEIWVQGTEP